MWTLLLVTSHNIVRYIAKEMQPFNTVEKQIFDSQYELPGRTYVSQTAVPQLYNSV